MGLRQGIDLCIGGKPAGGGLRIADHAIEDDVELARFARLRGDVGEALLDQSFPRTEGFRLIPSTGAIVDQDFHVGSLWPSLTFARLALARRLALDGTSR